MEKEILVIGSSNIDLIMKMEHLPRPGETVTNAIFMQTFGGKGANQAVAAARAGGNVVFVNCVGDDSFTNPMISNFRKEGIDVRFVFSENGIACGTALIMIDKEGQNSISVAPGANYCLTPEYLDRFRHEMQVAGMIVLQYEILPEMLEQTIDRAYQMGRKILLNLAPARPIDNKRLAKLYVLIVNETEAEFLTDAKVENKEQVRVAGETLLKEGPKIVIITLGTNGSYIASQEGIREFIPAFKVKAVDSTAAGDVYCGALAVALVEDKLLKDAVLFASAAAAISVTRLGAQPSAPTRKEIDELLSAHK